MKTSAAEAFYGTRYKIAQEFDVKPQTVYSWPDTVPARYAILIQHRTKGKLKIEPELYETKERARRA